MTAVDQEGSAPSPAGGPVARTRAADRLDGVDRRRLQHTVERAAVVLLVLTIAWFALTTDRFLTFDNARAILSSAALVGITALGATLVMIAGSTVSLATSQTATITAMVFLSTQEWGLGAATLCAVACGAVLSGVLGAAIGYWDCNPIVLTIAAGFAIVGLALWVSGGATVYPGADGYKVLNDTLLGLPFAVYVLLGLAIACQWLLLRTTLGRSMYLVGENRAAARAAGVSVGKVTTVAWVVFGVCIALTGIFLASFNTQANVAVGGTLTFDVIAAVLAGGTAIAGGRGSAVRTLGGALLIATISDVMLLRGYSTGAQILAKGVLVLMVVVLVHLRSREATR